MMTTEEHMAVLVLKGDMTAARALADSLCEKYAVGGIDIKPIKVCGKNTRAIIYINSNLEKEDYQIDGEALIRNVLGWMDNGVDDGRVLLAQGIQRIEFYELPEEQK